MSEIGLYLVLPVQILEDQTISDAGKILYAVIGGLTHNTNKKCFASNDYLAEKMNKSKVSISRLLKELEDAKYITREFTYKPNSKEVDVRYITVNINLNDQSRISSLKSQELDLNSDGVLNLSIPILENKDTGILENKTDNNKKNNNKDTISKDIDSAESTTNNLLSNINDLKDKDLLAKENNHLDKDNLEKKNNNSRNLKKVLIPFIQESFINDDVKQILTEWLLDVFANGKTLTLKQLENQCNMLDENSKTKEDLIDTVQRTLEGKWSTFRYVLENKNKTNNNNNNSVRITEQKRTVILGEQTF